MKKLLPILFFIILGYSLTAQVVDYSFGNVKHKRDKSTVPTVGIKGGLTKYDMHFAYQEYNKLPDDFVLKPGFGVFIEFPFKKPRLRAISIAGEVMMIERGMRKSFKFRGDMPEVDEIKANYIDVRIPITYYFRNAEVVNPYIFVAPDFAFCYGGEFSKTFSENPEYNTSVNVANSDALNSLDILLAAGVGVRFNFHFQVFTLIMKLDGSYHFGLLNTNGAKESTYVDNLAYHIEDESRYNRGFEVMLSIGIPLKFNFLHDSCWGW